MGLLHVFRVERTMEKVFLLMPYKHPRGISSSVKDHWNVFLWASFLSCGAFTYKPELNVECLHSKNHFILKSACMLCEKILRWGDLAVYA